MDDFFRIPPETIPGRLVKNLEVLLPWLPADPHDLDFAVDRYRETRTVATVAWDEPFDRVIPRWIKTMTVPTMVMWGNDDALIPVGQAQAWARPHPRQRRAPVRRCRASAPRRIHRCGGGGGRVLRMTATAVDVRRQPSRLELRAFAGLSMASAAISIDLILPAFGRIRADLGLAPDSAATAGLVTAFFLGMAFGPIPFGLLADRFGRRWVLAGQLRAVLRGCPGRGGRTEPALDVVGQIRLGARGSRVAGDRRGDDPRPVRRRRHGPGDGLRHDGVHARAGRGPGPRSRVDQDHALAGHVRRLRGVRRVDRTLVVAPSRDPARRAPTTAAAPSGGDRHDGHRPQPRRHCCTHWPAWRSSARSRRTWHRPNE